MKNIFGEDQQDPAIICKRRPHIIGTGSAGETCKTCKYLVHVGHHDKVYLKCEKMKNKWTHGPGTDIRAKDKACLWWEKKGT